MATAILDDTTVCEATVLKYSIVALGVVSYGVFALARWHRNRSSSQTVCKWLLFLEASSLIVGAICLMAFSPSFFVYCALRIREPAPYLVRLWNIITNAEMYHHMESIYSLFGTPVCFILGPIASLGLASLDRRSPKPAPPRPSTAGDR